MILFKIVQQFMLPSVFLFLFLLVGFVLTVRAPSQTIGKVVFLFALLLFYLFSITPVADRILRPLEISYLQLQDLAGGAETIVMLLGGQETNVLRASEVIRLSHIPRRIIISGTSSLHEGARRAKQVKQYLVERGIPSEQILLEDTSRNTFESAQNIKTMMGTKPFFLVTSGYHMPRSMEAFEALGAVPIAAPTDFKQEERYSLLDFFPSAQNLEKTDLAFHEYFGILFYRIMYY